MAQVVQLSTPKRSTGQQLASQIIMDLLQGKTRERDEERKKKKKPKIERRQKAVFDTLGSS